MEAERGEMPNQPGNNDQEPLKQEAAEGTNTFILNSTVQKTMREQIYLFLRYHDRAMIAM